MKLKVFIFTILVLLVLTAPLLAKEVGWLNVFTDINGTKIYVNGRLVAQDQLVGYELQVGEHYCMVELDGKKIYAKKFRIEANRTHTIVSDHFVDFRTKTPSRGAVDREAYRLRQVKGYAGFGAFFGSPISGLSAKWWINDRIGIQGIALVDNHNSEHDEQFAGRLLISFSDKVAFGYNVNAYLALGYGTNYQINNESIRDQQTTITSLAFGIEGKLGEVANALFLNKIFVIEDSGSEDNFLFFLFQIATLGILNTTYVSLELALENIEGEYLDNEEELKRSVSKVNFGVHYFF